MRGLDYRWIEALDSVVSKGSFERAAEQLFISQSAVSQRIKQLEKYLAQPVLIREQPPRPTLVGKKVAWALSPSLFNRTRVGSGVDEPRACSPSFYVDCDQC